MTLTFAYGTNMDRAGMRRRCPAASAVGIATLDGWRLMVMRAGYVSIAQQPGACVHGALWQLGPRELAALDAYEAVDAGLYDRRVLPVRVAGRRMLAQVYIGRSTVPGRPWPGHLLQVIAAARSWDLPADYLDEMQRLADAA